MQGTCHLRTTGQLERHLGAVGGQGDEGAGHIQAYGGSPVASRQQGLGSHRGNRREGNQDDAPLGVSQGAQAARDCLDPTLVAPADRLDMDRGRPFGKVEEQPGHGGRFSRLLAQPPGPSACPGSRLGPLLGSPAPEGVLQPLVPTVAEIVALHALGR